MTDLAKHNIISAATVARLKQIKKWKERKKLQHGPTQKELFPEFRKSCLFCFWNMHCRQEEKYRWIMNPCPPCPSFEKKEKKL